jgi:hypothetical protein
LHLIARCLLVLVAIVIELLLEEIVLLMMPRGLGIDRQHDFYRKQNRKREDEAARCSAAGLQSKLKTSDQMDT